jgi:tRNA pseudouridine55 synthase
MNGILLVDKPSGWTSFDVVAKVRSMLRQPKVQSSEALDIKTLGHSTRSPKVKVGHTGTLDPLATGLLVLVIGDYTKRAQELTKLDKTYEVTMKLGQTSTTGDAEGIITPVTRSHLVKRGGAGLLQSKIPLRGDLEAVLKGFMGEIAQIPPKFSAIKIDGQRAYKLARAGKEVKLEPRKVTIYEITDVAYAYPEVKFTAAVSSGTYIRSLVEDIGEKLGAGAYMTALNRVSVGGFSLKNAAAVDGLSAETINKCIQTLPSSELSQLSRPSGRDN